MTAVINLDLPASLEVYRHRVGRTARGGSGGTAISMVSPDGADEALLAELQAAYGGGGAFNQFGVDMRKLAALPLPGRGRLRAVTRAAVKEARLKELKQELLHLKRLASHFEDNPEDLKVLRHDRPLATTRKQPHLAHVPTYPGPRPRRHRERRRRRVEPPPQGRRQEARRPQEGRRRAQGPARVVQGRRAREEGAEEQPGRRRKRK